MPDSSGRLGWTVTLFALAIVDGIALQARGPLLVSFQETFQVSESLLGLVSPMGTIGFVLTIVLVGAMAGRLRIRLWFVVGVLGTAISFVAMGLAPTFFLLLGMITVRMAATGTYRALDRPVLSHLYPSQRGRIFNIHTMVWAIGATAGPLFVTAVLWVTDWRAVYLILAAALVPIGIALWWLDVPASLGNERSFTRADFRRIAGRRELLVMVAGLVLVGGIESVFFTWLPYYATEFFRPEVANLTLSLYLAAYVPGRYLFSRITHRYPYLAVALLACAITAILLPVMFALGGHPGFFPAVFAIGLLVSGFFPTLLAWGVDVTPEFTGPINAAAMTAAQVGFFVFPASVGVIADRRSIQAGMLIQVALTVGLVAVIGGGRWYSRAR